MVCFCAAGLHNFRETAKRVGYSPPRVGQFISECATVPAEAPGRCIHSARVYLAGFATKPIVIREDGRTTSGRNAKVEGKYIEGNL